MNDDALRSAMTAVDRAISEPLALPRRPVALPRGPSIDSLLDERKTIHGDFTDDASASQRLKAVMRHTENWERLSEVQYEALEQICTKIGRILSGDPNHKDHWSDVIGYCTLVMQRL